MRSIKTKSFLLIFGALIGLFILMSYVADNVISEAVEDDCFTTMSILVNEKTRTLDYNFNRIERGVKRLDKYIEENIDTVKLRSDSSYNREFYSELSEKCAVVGGLAGDVAAVYFRPNPDVYGSTSGVFMTDNGNNELVNVMPTDILKYSKSDREYVAWYYEAVDSGEPTWIKPYKNKNINVYMMSYVIPIYKNGSLLGIVGMDVKVSELSSIIDSTEYKDGTAFLASNDGDIIYHKDYPEGVSVKHFSPEMRAMARYITPQFAESSQIYSYSMRGNKYRIISRNLDNGMILALSVPEKGIKRNVRVLRVRMIVLFIIVIAVVAAIFWRLMVIIVLPIKELTKASSRIAKGELNTVITYKSDDEIGTLAKSVSLMAQEIKEYFAYIHSQAYTDAMTGVGNKAAYMDVVKRMETKISEGMATFIVIVFDINGLKNVNDNLGHEYGDMLITDAAGIMKNVFSTEHVFRIGGDEFIVVIENKTQKDITDYFEKFDKKLVRFNENNKRYQNALEISKGGVPYDSKQDTSYKDVFRRADDMMYKDKAEYYRGRNDRRR